MLRHLLTQARGIVPKLSLSLLSGRVEQDEEEREREKSQGNIGTGAITLEITTKVSAKRE